MRVLLVLISTAAVLCAGCRGPSSGNPDSTPPPVSGKRALFAKAAEALKPLHRAKKPGSWMLGPGKDEEGQTFDEYADSNPVKPDAQRRTLYIVLLGEFDGERRKIVDLCAEFMGLYFNLPVKFADPIPLSAVPESNRRIHPSWGMKQIRAGYVLDEVLLPKVPKDAVALIAFTKSDLYPQDDWNFVFGMASLYRRVGVWSIYRYGDPSTGARELALCLKRTIKVGTHETGHMFGIHHCTRYECNMNGSNNLEESDGCPLALCPECVRKIWWACDCDPVGRYADLESFCRKHGMTAEADFYKASREKIEPVFANPGQGGE